MWGSVMAEVICRGTSDGSFLKFVPNWGQVHHCSLWKLVKT